MIVRTYACLNRNCRHEFDSTADFPPCPCCRGLRVQWVPKPVAIRGASMAAIDQTARELAADFGLTNFRSPEIGQPAVRPPVANKQHNTFEPMPGWKIELPDGALTGAGAAVCMPTGVTAKVKVDPNAGGLKEADPKMGLDAMRAATTFEGRHRPKG